MLFKALISFFIQFVGSILGFLFQFLAAKLLGAEEYGKFNYYFGYIGSIGVLFFFGLSYYLPKIIHKHDKNNIISQVLLLHLLIFIPSSIILFFVFFIFFENIFLSFIIITGIYVFSIIEIIRSYYVSIIRPIKAIFLKSFLVNLLMILIFILFFNFNKSFWILLISFIFSHLLVIIPFLIIKIKFTKLDFNFFKGTFTFYLVQILYITYAHFSKVLQGEFQNFELVGILSISIVVGKIISMLGTNFSLVLMPEFSKAWDKKNFKLIESYFNQISRINIYVVTPLAVFFIINSNKILSLVGESFQGGDIIFILLIISSTVTAYVGPNGAVLLMTNNVKKEIFNGFLMLFSGIFFGLIFGKNYFYGIALSIFLSEIIVAISKRSMTYKLLNLKFLNNKSVFYILLLIVIEIIIFEFLSNIIIIEYWLIFNVLILIILISLSFILSPNKNDYLFINGIVIKIKQKYYGNI